MSFPDLIVSHLVQIGQFLEMNHFKAGLVVASSCGTNLPARTMRVLDVNKGLVSKPAIDVNEGNPVTMQSFSHPQWSPDGQCILFFTGAFAVPTIGSTSARAPVLLAIPVSTDLMVI